MTQEKDPCPGCEDDLKDCPTHDGKVDIQTREIKEKDPATLVREAEEAYQDGIAHGGAVARAGLLIMKATIKLLSAEVERLIGHREFYKAAYEGEVARYEAMTKRAEAGDRCAEALRRLHDNDVEYIRINNLSGAEDNQVLKEARAALAAHEAAKAGEGEGV